jgi:hypothetical protein
MLLGKSPDFEKDVKPNLWCFELLGYAIVVGDSASPGDNRRSSLNECRMVATLTKVNQKHTFSPVNVFGRPGAIEADRYVPALKV